MTTVGLQSNLDLYNFGFVLRFLGCCSKFTRPTVYLTPLAQAF